LSADIKANPTELSKYHNNQPNANDSIRECGIRRQGHPAGFVQQVWL